MLNIPVKFIMCFTWLADRFLSPANDHWLRLGSIDHNPVPAAGSDSHCPPSIGVAPMYRQQVCGSRVSSAYFRLFVNCPLRHIPSSSCPSQLSSITYSRNILNRWWESGHPWRTSLLVGNLSVVILPFLTVAQVTKFNPRMSSMSPMTIFLQLFQFSCFFYQLAFYAEFIN